MCYNTSFWLKGASVVALTWKAWVNGEIKSSGDHCIKNVRIRVSENPNSRIFYAVGVK